MHTTSTTTPVAQVSEISARVVPRSPRSAPPGDTFSYFVFDDSAMETHLPATVYSKIRELQVKGGSMDPDLAESVAYGMKEWAIEKGASCFTHWFHPLTEKTARKYDSFMTPKRHVGYACDAYHITQFTGKQLLQGEPDGSSFPSGGLRKTSEARGYTAWDCTSPAFVVSDELGGCLYIPAVFCSIFGLSMDSKTPLLKSERAISAAVMRVLKLIQSALEDVPSAPLPSDIYCTIGVEQEMFIIDRNLYNRRPDLITSGRTLIGRLGPKGQQLADHYWGQVPRRVLEALHEVQERLWSLGYPVTTVHNEVAPAQFEMAPIFERASVASDHNMIMMEMLRKVCEKHDLSVLFHEKPFSKVNGSGKHTNWSLATDSGENLLAPGNDPSHNTQFLFIFSAFLRAVYLHSDVLRAYVSVPGNEFRLGGMEAPPAIISVFIGQHLEQITRDFVNPSSDSASSSLPTLLDLGLATLPRLHQDKSDRNRTSPLAFTGNRFEFRAVGSSQNCAGPITAINAIVTESLLHMADEVDKHVSSGINKKMALLHVIRATLSESLPIIYNGDCYEKEYVEDMAKKRGIPNIPSPVEALRLWTSPKNKTLFSNLNIMGPAEVEARGHVWIEHFSKVKSIEASCILDMAQRMILPSALNYQKTVCKSTLLAHNTLSVLKGDTKVLPNTMEQTWDSGEINTPLPREAIHAQHQQIGMCLKLNCAVESLCASIQSLQTVLSNAERLEDEVERAQAFYSSVGPAMLELRGQCDNIEGIVDHALWPIPTYSEIFANF
ncbi:glutamine synthetase [Pelomyxa schiedti]|nr:glutamine synthetase [Pelomyxa schiedti]